MDAKVQDLISRLRARDEQVKDQGGDYLYRGSGDALVREAADALERLHSSGQGTE